MAEPAPSTLDPWVSPTGVVAHPDAPAGGGGFGVFTGAGQVGSTGNVLDAFPDPRSPAGRQIDPLDLQDKAEKLDETPQKPPPLIAQDQKQTVNNVTVTIKADQKNVAAVKEGEGDSSWQVDPGATPEIEHDGPEDASKVDKKKNKVTKLTGPAPVITVTIQTRYKTASSATGKSAYGRGTTDQDKKDGNTSLGFHEACHRQDYLDFLKNHTLPKFGGKVGQTIEQYEKAVDDYNKAVFDYQDKGDAFTEKNTDEVGNPTKSNHVAAQTP